MYAPFRDGGEWAEYQYVEKMLYKELGVDARDFIRTFPVGLVFPEPSFGSFYVQPDQTIGLTIAGVRLCHGSAEDVRIFLEALKLFVKLEAEHLPPPTGGAPLEAGSHELQTQLGFSEQQAARVYHLFHTEVGLLGGGGGNPTNWRFQLTPDLRRFAGVETIDDYIERRIVPQPYNRAPISLMEEVTIDTAIYVGASGRTYRVVESILGGGFGEVVRVVSDDGGEYALKTLKLDLPDRDGLMHEVESLQRVEHENVIRYIDYGTDPETFLVMELAHGGSLQQRIDAARQQGAHFPFETILAWASQMLAGVCAVHEVLIHRDLKPANVLFEGDTLKIGDFGIARVVDASTGTLTFKGFGTPLYLPPEGWEGASGRSPTSAYDLYSLGVILFELVTLRAPFEGDRSTLAQAHMYEAPPAPVTLRADTPLQLNALILQLLQKDPAQRGGDARTLLETLGRIRANLRPADPDAGISPSVASALERLRQGVSSLVQQESEEEARRRAYEEDQRRRLATFHAGIDLLTRLVDEARAIVEAHIAPLNLTAHYSDSGTWQFRLPPSPLELRISVGQASSDSFPSDMRPGEIVGFGEIHVAAPRDFAGRSDPRAGANIVIFFRPETAWVPNLQIIELENNAIVGYRMRAYEPFFLERGELAEHGRWLWGGATHVFQPKVQELTADVLVQWLSRLVP